MTTKRDIVTQYCEFSIDGIKEAQEILERDSKINAKAALAKNNNFLLLMIANTLNMILKSMSVDDWGEEK